MLFGEFTQPNGYQRAAVLVSNVTEATLHVMMIVRHPHASITNIVNVMPL